MQYVVAVSGGVDSVVLLDMLVKGKKPEDTLIVAHFDHGIRPDSVDDALFVADLAKRYGLQYATRREVLGPLASEALARQRRYAFLHEVATAQGALLVTAHHLDDLVETVAINLTRGTGWRGLAVFQQRLLRPLITTPKADVLAYARQNGLLWREDSTNQKDTYLRNRIRKKTTALPEATKKQLGELYARQRALRDEIEREAYRLVGPGPQYSRHLLTNMGDTVALECLRTLTKGMLTRPQLARVLFAVKTNKAGTVTQPGGGLRIYFTTRHFSVELVKL